MYVNKKLKQFNPVTLRFNDELMEKINLLTEETGGERAVFLREIIESYIREQEFLSRNQQPQVKSLRH